MKFLIGQGYTGASAMSDKLNAVYMYVCKYVCMYVCMRACVHVCIYACMHACVCVSVCMYACMHACTGVRQAKAPTCTLRPLRCPYLNLRVGQACSIASNVNRLAIVGNSFLKILSSLPVSTRT
jgi:hypothetical protein